jgi:hypothetical protein
MINRAQLIALLLAATLCCRALANESTVSSATVTRVQAYETNDGSTSVWLWLNGNARVGPNPSNTSNTCELWTNS